MNITGDLGVSEIRPRYSTRNMCNFLENRGMVKIVRRMKFKKCAALPASFVFEEIVYCIHCISRSMSEFNPSGKLTNILYVTKSKFCGVIHRLSR